MTNYVRKDEHKSTKKWDCNQEQLETTQWRKTSCILAEHKTYTQTCSHLLSVSTK